jgi:endoglycosylceramidase
MITLGLLLVGLASAATIAPSSFQSRLRVDPSTQDFVLDDGRTVVLHGLNAVYKVKPFLPCYDCPFTEDSMNEQDMELLRSWGFTAVRLGVMVSGVLPTAMGGAVNSTYLDEIVKLSDLMGAHGLYVLADAHQDDLSPKFCGEGFPDFMIAPHDKLESWEEFPFPVPIKLDKDPVTGYPNITQCLEVPFAVYNAAVEENSAWGGIYDNATVRGHFANHWTAVAQAFGGAAASPASQLRLLGYELLNEPIAYPLWDALVPGLSDQKNLVGMYQQLYSAIRSQDNDTVVFYEPIVSETMLYQETGFKTGPGGAGDDKRQALSVHMYCANQNSTGDITNVTICEDSLKGIFEVAGQNFATVGGGRMMTEFGAVGPHESSAESLAYLLDMADGAGLSWTYWTYKSYHDITTQNGATETMFDVDGQVQPLKLAALSRSYPHLVPAEPGSLQFKFNRTSPLRELVVNYVVRRNVTSPGVQSLDTVLYGNPAVHYVGGATVTVSPSFAGSVEMETNSTGAWTGWVTVHHNSSTRGIPVTVTMRANTPQVLPTE